MKNGFNALVLIMAGLLPLNGYAQARVEDPWARPTVAGQQSAGGYLLLKGGAVADRLLSATSTVAASIELHRMSLDGDVMRMRPVSEISVPAGETVPLAPGGLHLMFQGLKSPLKAGEKIEVLLRFEKAGFVKVPMRVKAPHGTHGHDHSRDHGHGH
jgi:copper(I)-binding protein